ncbi:MAG: GNAT family N-acetyltransferase [Cyclobacteriaceae bacterium]
MENRILHKDNFQDLHQAFCLAFSNYKVKMNPTEAEFDLRIHKKLNIDYGLSGATFDGDEMVAFILHTSNIYEGIPTAFNGGTGVIPGFRNQKTGEELYEFLLPRIIEKSIARILLEVIDTNDRAIRLYEKMGFCFRRNFLCYKLEKPEKLTNRDFTTEGSLTNINESFADFEPSFADSKLQLLLGNEKVLVTKKDDKINGYIVFQPASGRISQIAVSRLSREEGLGKMLVSGAMKYSDKPLTVMNVPDDEIGFQRFLTSCGFENQVNQFEMELII